MDIGVGLWTMRSTAARPDGFPALYHRLMEDARLAEALGFHSLWVAEHHFWYDGWCPATVTACSVVLGATTRLRAGTGIHLLSLWEPERAALSAETVARLSGGRLELGVGLGYREEEFDGFAISKRTRGRRMDVALDYLQEHWSAGERHAPIMVGGFSDHALRRAASRGLGIFLPFSMDADKLARTIERYRSLAAEAGQPPGRVAMLKYIAMTDGSDAARTGARETIARSAREYSGAWFPLRGRPGFESPHLLERQLGLATDNALIGPAEHVACGLRDLEEMGVDLVVLQVTRDDVVVDYRGAMRAVAEHVLPAVAWA
jgi:alkanesulfonate monooxygenase SsuD/methylene tetrahydromethanopterin reductase-like flavin-dependent oxidoreductase (luciferase family)